MNPGDLCRIVTDAGGRTTHIEHIAPCALAGFMTDVRTHRVDTSREVSR